MDPDDFEPEWKDINPGSTEALAEDYQSIVKMNLEGQFYPIHPIYPWSPVEGGMVAEIEKQGTVFFINSGGVFLTAKHVVEQKADCPYAILIMDVANKRCIHHRVEHLAVHPKHDAAIGKIRVKDVPRLRLGVDTLAVGEEVLFWGFPATQFDSREEADGTALAQNFHPAMSEGVISDIHPEHPYGWVYQADARLHGGMSGGPMLRKVNGMISAHGIISRGMRGQYEFAVSIASLIDWPIPFLNNMSLREFEAFRPGAFPIVG